MISFLFCEIMPNHSNIIYKIQWFLLSTYFVAKNQFLPFQRRNAITELILIYDKILKVIAIYYLVILSVCQF